MHKIEYCIRDDENGKVYCLDPNSGAAIEITTRIDAKTVNLTDLPEKIARDLVCLSGRLRRIKSEVLSQDEISTLLNEAHSGKRDEKKMEALSQKEIGIILNALKTE
jgi:hypothetical protein